jgi:predicted enzyme related to lactoylglutathione lyase
MCPKAGRFSWNELVTTNTQAAADFYGKLFGWQTSAFVPPGTPPGAPPYTVFKTGPDDEMGAGGMMQAMHPAAPSQWVPYVVVEQANASVAAAVALGAKVLLPVMAIGGVGRVAVIQDPLGATIGLHELPA